MSLLRITPGPPLAVRLHYLAGQRLVKAAGDAAPVFNLAGQLYLSNSGYLPMAVPNALVRGVFQAMQEPGAELPLRDGLLNAHCTVMSPTDIERFGGPDRITERGKSFRYTLGRVYEVVPDNWPGVRKVWYIKIHSPELQQLRRSYGLSGLPNDGQYDFHVTIGILRRGVLGRSETAKGGADG